MKIGTCIEATTGCLIDMRNPQSAFKDLISFARSAQVVALQIGLRPSPAGPGSTVVS